MTTLLLATSAANPAVEAANDNDTPNWTAHPTAQRLLASFAKTPPPTRAIPRHQRWDRRETVFTGFRVSCLQVIRSSVLDPAFRAAERAGRVTDMRAITQVETVEEAIEDALRIPPLQPIATQARQLNPACWGEL